MRVDYPPAGVHITSLYFHLLFAVVDVRDGWAEEAAAAIRKETETKATYVKTDLRRPSDIEAMVAA